MKKALLILAAIAGTLTLSAQNKKGGIDAKLLGERPEQEGRHRRQAPR